MSWISGNCQGDRNYECYYGTVSGPWQTWCVDSNEYCPGWNDGGALIKVVDHTRPSGGGGW
jgi:hypothetical protein